MFDLEQISHLTKLNLIDFHARLGSTNDRALQLIKQDQIEYPALVLAESQSAGRGQRNRQWWSGEGSLTFSWISSIPKQQVSKVAVSLTPASVALAVAESIEHTTELAGIKIKWPNDLLVIDRKIGGILIETVTTTEGTSVVMGVGINVNNTGREMEAATTTFQHSNLTPTSVLMETRKQTSVTQLLIEIVRRLESEFACLQSHWRGIVDRFNHRLFLRDQQIRITIPGRQDLIGVCEGINDDGGLILSTINGTEVVFSGTIKAV